MIAKKIPNRGTGGKAVRVSGLSDYIVNPELSNGKEKCIASGAENFLTDTHEGHQSELLALAQESVRSKDPIDHWVMSWRNDEHPTHENAKQAVEIFIKQCGLQGHQYIWGLHDDTENKHVHVMVNRVHPDTLKVIKINKGFDKEAAQQAIALIEHAQGWRSEDGARYIIENDMPVMTSDAKKTRAERIEGISTEPVKVTTHAASMEIMTGEKSALRIAIEVAAPIIKQASSWKELHAQLAEHGMQYTRKGSGAMVFVGDVSLKASDVDRKAAGLSKLEKRFGPYQPAQEIKQNEYHHHTARTATTSRVFSAEEQNALAPGKDTADCLRNLSQCRLAILSSGKQKSRAGVLSIDARPDRRHAGRLRRDTGRDATRISKPLTPGQAGWKQYQELKEEQRSAKAAETATLAKQQAAERTALFEKLKAERTELFKGSWKGKGDLRNAMQSVLATQQAAFKLELAERHRAERQELQALFKPFPQYKIWQEQPQFVCENLNRVADLELDGEQRSRSPRLSDLFKSMTHTIDHRRHVTFKIAGLSIFRDEGRTLAVLDQSSNSLAATLAVAQQKFGNTLTLTGNDEFKRRAVAAAVENNMFVKFADPALESMRLKLSDQKRQTEREAQSRAVERQRVETTRVSQVEPQPQPPASTQKAHVEKIVPPLQKPKDSGWSR